MAYIISHVTIAISSESCAIKQNVTSSKDVPDHKHIVHDESNPSASTCTLSDWPYYWIYFTNWSWTLLCLSFLLDTTLTVLRYRKERMHLHHIVGESKTASADKGSHSKQVKIKCFLIFCSSIKLITVSANPMKKLGNQGNSLQKSIVVHFCVKFTKEY